MKIPPFSRHVDLPGALVLLSALLLSMTTVLGAGDFTVVERVELIVDDAGQARDVLSFPVKNPGARYTLRIERGDLEGSGADSLSGVKVTLNGKLLEAALPDAEATLAISLGLEADNELTVEIHGEPGAAILFSVHGFDADPPEIRATVSPEPNGDGWHHDDAFVSFECDDRTTEVRDCPAPIELSDEGAEQQITATATDEVGNQTTVTVELNLDRTPPGLMPQVQSDPVTGQSHVAFLCDDEFSGIAACPAPLLLQAGTEATVSATDRAGNEIATTFRMQADLEQPVQVVSSTTGAPSRPRTTGRAAAVRPEADAEPGEDEPGTDEIPGDPDPSGTGLDRPEAETGESVSCTADALGQGYWHRQCLGAGLISPGRNGRGPQEPLEPDFVKTLIPAVDARLQTTIFEFDTCQDGMDADPPRDKCEKAKKHYTALLLNLASGRLQDGCGIDLSSRGCDSGRIFELVELEIPDLINSGDDSSCQVAVACAETLNENRTPLGDLDDIPPSIVANVTPPANGNGWNNTDVTVEFVCDDASGVLSCPDPVVLTAEGAGQTATGTAVDLAGNTASAFVTVNIDKTPPTAAAIPAPAPNAAGWNNTDVTVSYTCADALSGVDTCPDDILVTAEGAGQSLLAAATDLAGNSVPVPVTLNIDKTPPVVTTSQDPEPNENGWNNTPVTVTFDCQDPVSGVPDPPDPVTVPLEGARTIPGTCTDLAGNSTTAIHSVQIDLTPPAVLAGLTPPANGNGWNNTAVTVDFQCVDSLSGVASCTDDAVLAGEGTGQTVTGVGVDLAGNVGSADAVVNIDLTPPVITADASPPPNAAGWNNTDVTVTFDCADALSGVDACPGAVLVSDEGADQAVPGSVSDLAGNVAQDEAIINLDRTPPAFTDFLPALCPALTLDLTPRVRACFADALSGPDVATLLLTVSGVDVTAGSTIDGPCILWDAPASLTVGEQQAEVQMQDVAGNSSQAEWCFQVFPPSIDIAIDFPQPNLLTRDDFIDVTGTVQDLAETVDVNGVPATISAGGTFEALGVPLREGRTVLTAVARNAQGAVGTASIPVIRDTTPPTVVFETPRDGAVLTSLQVDVAGLVNDLTSGTTINADDCQVFVNGVEATVANRSFLVPDFLLTRGRNTLVAEARDRLGNLATATITVQVEDQAGQRIVQLSGNGQTAGIGDELPRPLRVGLFDANGDAVEGRPVTFQVSRGNGQISAFPEEGSQIVLNTDEFGQASVLFQLGDRTGAGNNRVLATAAGFLGEVEFCATAQGGPPSRITTLSGDNQRGVTSSELPLPLVVIVTDAGGNPVGGVDVDFEVVGGGGDFGGLSVVTIPTDLDGLVSVRWSMGPDEGVSNNQAIAGFATLAGDGVATFTASARNIGDPSTTRLVGVVLDNQDIPVEGATVGIDGTTLEAVTDAQGEFAIAGAPVGTIHFHVDGTTSNRAGTWPVLEFELTTISGQDNDVGSPIYLLPLDTANAAVVGGGEDVTLVMDNIPGAELTIFGNSVTCPGGSSTCVVSFTQVRGERVPMAPPLGSAFMLAWTVQPAGVHFDPPAAICIPNTSMAPGSQVEMFSFDHDIGEFIAIGTSTVTEDGAQLCSDPGFGITKAGWGGCVPPPPPDTCVDGCSDGNPCTRDFCEDGSCKHEPANDGLRCDDGSGCSSRECQGGSCVTLEQTPDGTPCDDANECTENERCQGGSCRGDQVDCDDMNDCTDDSCHPVFGCLNGANSATCDDGDPCTDGDQCDNGACVSGEPKDCDDDDSCTMDSCDASGNCVNDPDPAMEGMRCDDMSGCEQATCQMGTCVEEGAAPDGEDCDDMNGCTEMDMCMEGMCKGTPVELGAFAFDGTIGAEVTAPDTIKNKVQSAINAIPGLGGVSIDEVKGGISGKAKDCCNEETGEVVENGQKEGSATITIGAKIKGLTIWGPPTISRFFDFGVVEVEVDFEAGITVDSNWSIAGEFGKRSNACKEEDNCLFGGVKGGAAIVPKLTLEAIICTESFWTARSCFGITITPASFVIPITGGFGWNLGGCGEGLSGSLKVAPIKFKAEFCLGVPGSSCVSFEREIFQGFTIF